MAVAIQTTVLDVLGSAQNSSDGSLNVVITSGAPTAGTVKQAAITVGTSAVRATHDGSAPDASRVLLMVKPDPSSSATFYIGDSSVTNSGSDRGVPLVGGESFVTTSDAGDYYIIASTAGQTVFITEQE